MGSRIQRSVRSWLAVVASVSLLAGLACGGSSEEAEFREASEALAEAQSEADVAREQVEVKRTALESAREALDDAEAELASAEDRVAEARTALARFATDDVVFRAVQLALLETPELADVAIRANVQDGVVSLWGSVGERKLRERAVEVAEAIPGVVAVENHIAVEDAASQGETEVDAPEDELLDDEAVSLDPKRGRLA
ncbi:MAG: BON domain-containing protein [Myxococcales bacterium]|nr:BON domain-containing protein [Myxococcales bacterium]